MYNSSGDRMETVFFTNAGFLAFRVLYTYDGSGTLTEEITYDASGRLWSKKVYTASPEGRTNERTSYTTGGSLEGRSVITYDPDGNVAEEFSYGPDGTLSSRRVNVYDSQGHPVESTLYTDALRLQYAYRYNSNRNLIEMLTRFNDGSESSITYTYQDFDSFGNWTKRDCLRRPDDARWVEYRLFTYYGTPA